MLSYYYIYERSNILTQKGCSYPEEESPKEEEEEGEVYPIQCCDGYQIYSPFFGLLVILPKP